MTDHGIEYAVGSDYGKKVRLTVDDALLVLTYLRDGAEDTAGGRADAYEVFAHSLKRRDEVRHWVIPGAAEPFVARAIDRIARDGRGTEAMEEMRRYLDVAGTSPEEWERIREIEVWFYENTDRALFIKREPDRGWVAMFPTRVAAGNAPAAYGDTRLDAAEHAVVEYLQTSHLGAGSGLTPP